MEAERDGERESLVSSAPPTSMLSSLASGRSEDPRLQRGIGLTLATVFLLGEMAGSGMIALPATLVGTGVGGLLLVLFFSVNCAYMGSRLAVCWEILAEKHPEFRPVEEGCVTLIRDPYPLIAQRAGEVHSQRLGRALRIISIGK